MPVILIKCRSKAHVFYWVLLWACDRFQSCITSAQTFTKAASQDTESNYINFFFCFCFFPLNTAHPASPLFPHCQDLRPCSSPLTLLCSLPACAFHSVRSKILCPLYMKLPYCCIGSPIVHFLYAISIRKGQVLWYVITSEGFLKAVLYHHTWWAWNGASKGTEILSPAWKI